MTVRLGAAPRRPAPVLPAFTPPLPPSMGAPEPEQQTGVRLGCSWAPAELFAIGGTQPCSRRLADGTRWSDGAASSAGIPPQRRGARGFPCPVEAVGAGGRLRGPTRTSGAASPAHHAAPADPAGVVFLRAGARL